MPGLSSRVPAALMALWLTAAFATTSVRAQSVEGVVRETSSRRPVSSAVVTLTDSAGTVHARVLSGATGRFRLRAPGAGIFSVEAEGMGLGQASTDVLVPEGAVVGVVLRLDVVPVTLEGIDASPERRCRLASDAGAEVQSLWEAVRSALATNAAADGSGVMRYQVMRYTRRLEPETLTIEDEQVVQRGVWSERPFRSHGVDVLVDEGFARSEAGGAVYYAPDADVLLSDRFLETHCFNLDSAGEEHLVGLSFRPLDVRRNIPDVRGTLWVERETARLSHLDVSYVNPPGPAGWVSHPALGARVDFRDVGNGTWIVSAWAIRMPIIVSRPGPFGGAHRFRVAGIAEEGGRVLNAVRSGRRIFAGESGGLRGRVSQLDGPGWRVGLVGTGRTAPVAEDGSFRFDALPSGSYDVALLDPRLLGLDGDVVVAQADVAVGPPTDLSLRRLPVDRTMSQICVGQRWSPHSAVLVGEVVDERTGTGARGAVVEATWQQVRGLDVRGGEVNGTDEVRATRTDDLGSFLLCDVPVEVPVSVLVGFQGRLEEIPVRVPPGRVVHAVVVTVRDQKRGVLTPDF